MQDATGWVRSSTSEQQVSQQHRPAIPGLLCTAAGGVVSLALVPANVESYGALFGPSLAMTAGLLAGPLIDVMQRRSLRPLIRLENILLVSLVYWIFTEPLQRDYSSDVQRQGVLDALLAVLVFTCCLRLGVFFDLIPIPAAMQALARARLTDRQIYSLGIAAFTLGFFPFVFWSDFSPAKLIAGIFAPRFAAPWSVPAMGGWRSFVDHLPYFGYCLPSIVFILVMRLGWKHRYTLICAMLTLFFFACLAQSGSRIETGSILGSALFLYLAYRGERIQWRQVVVTALALGTLMVLFEAQLTFRSTGFRGKGQESRDMIGVHVDKNLIRMAQVFELIPKKFPHAGVDYLVWVVVRPIPRAIWPNKPTDAGFDVPAMLGIRGMTITITTVGELYAAFGWIGVALGGLVIGGLAASWGKLLQDNSTDWNCLLYALGVMAWVLAMRSLVLLILQSYALIALYFLHRITRSYLSPR